jgi:SulP family sulfate permease
MKRMAEVSNVKAITREVLEQDELSEETRERWRGLVPRGVEVYDVNGPFFFGAADTFSDILSQVSGRPKAIIIDLEGAPAMDSTGLRALSTLVQRRTREGVPVFVVGLQPQPRELILRSPVADLLGRDRLNLSPEAVIEMIRNQGLVTISRETQVPDGQPGGRADGQ